MNKPGILIAAILFAHNAPAWSQDIEVKERLALHGHECMAFISDGKLFAAGCNRSVTIFDTKTGKPQTVLKGHTNDLLAIAVAKDGKMLASSGEDDTVKLWDLTTYKEILSLKGQPGVRCLAFSPDGKTLATASSYDKEATVKSGIYSFPIHLWDTATGKKTATFWVYDRHVRTLAYTPDGKQLASLTGDAIVFWDPVTGKTLSTISAADDAMVGMAFSADGKTLVTTNLLDIIDKDKKQFDQDVVKLWDVETGKKLKAFKGHTHWVRCVAFSPDGRIVASGGFDKSVKLWDTATGKNIAELKHSGIVNSVAFSADGNTLASVSNGDALKLWNVTTLKKH